MNNKEKNEQTISFILICLVATTAAAGVVFSKISLKEFPPSVFIFFRFTLATFTILPYLFLKERDTFNKIDLKVILISLLPVLNIIFFTYGIRYTTATSSQVLYSAIPVFVFIVSWFFLKDRARNKKIIGLLLGLMGVVITILLPIIEKSQLAFGSIKGNLLILAGVVTFAIYSVSSKKLQKKYSPMFLTSLFIILTMFSQLLFAARDINWYLSWWFKVSPLALTGLLYVTFGQTVFYYFLYQYVIKRSSPLIASLAFYIQPIATYALAMVFLGENLSVGIIIGAILTFVGAWLVTKAR